MSDAALQSLLNLVAVGLERQRAQEEVNRAQVVRQSEELKSTLLDAIAHEFKTPLTSIKAVTTDLLSNPEESLSQHRADWSRLPMKERTAYRGWSPKRFSWHESRAASFN